LCFFRTEYLPEQATPNKLLAFTDHLWEGRYSPKWIDGRKRSRNVYAHTREECEEKLVVLIREMKAELTQLKAQAG